MCGRFESKPNAEGLLTQLKQLNIDLIVEKEDILKTVNIALTEKIIGIKKNFWATHLKHKRYRQLLTLLLYPDLP